MGAAIATELLGGKCAAASIAAIIGAHHGMTIPYKDADDLDAHSQYAENIASYCGKGGRSSKNGKLWARVRRE